METIDPFAILAIALNDDTEDAIDLGKGARLIPDEVTMRRRRGEYVNFIPGEKSNKWVDINGKIVSEDIFPQS